MVVGQCLHRSILSQNKFRLSTFSMPHLRQVLIFLVPSRQAHVPLLQAKFGRKFLVTVVRAFSMMSRWRRGFSLLCAAYRLKYFKIQAEAKELLSLVNYCFAWRRLLCHQCRFGLSLHLLLSPRRRLLMLQCRFGVDGLCTQSDQASTMHNLAAGLCR